MKPITLLFLLLIVFTAFSQEEVKEVKLEKVTFIENIPSASGLSYYNKQLWMVGDDSPFLYVLDEKLNIENKFLISHNYEEGAKRQDKTIKADFESIAMIGDTILVAGSGSVVESRDTMVLFHLKEKKIIGKFNMRYLYTAFLKEAGFDSSAQINIEAFCSDRSFVYLINRGNICNQNTVFKIPKEEFVSSLNNGIAPKFEFFKFILPAIEGYKSGFSGACIDPVKRILYFTSSVEATKDVYLDGEVLGSFIGEIELDNLNESKIQFWPLSENGKFIKTKLESISLVNKTKNNLHFICTSDNDDGSSGVYNILLNTKK